MLQARRSPVRVPNEVNFFNLPNPSSRIVALGSTQNLTEMNTRNLPGGKSGRRIGLTTLPPSLSRMSENVGTSTSRNPVGPPRPVTGIASPYIILHCILGTHESFISLIFIIVLSGCYSNEVWDVNA
jgi:hypothetical protein